MKEPVQEPEKILNLEAYSPQYMEEPIIDQDEDSPRFGQPKMYKIKITENKTRRLEIKTNWMTINEIRQMEGLKRLPGADIVLG